MNWGVNGGPPPTWAASAEPEDHNSEVKLYDTGIKSMLVQEMGHFSASKARSVASTEKLRPQPPQLCKPHVAA